MLERVTVLAPVGARDSIARTLVAIADSEARMIATGAIAGALQGSPIVLPTDRVDVVVHTADRERALAASAGTAVRIRDDLPGTRGYGDLARGADALALDDCRAISVAGLQDLLRLALSDRDDVSATSAAIGLDAALRAGRSHPGSVSVTTRAEAQAAIERWLDQQSPLT